MAIPKNLSIVKLETRHHRDVARKNWNLTKEQMKGMHVHHRVPVSEGGTNDPSNLYVCSPSMHRWGWHNGEEFIEWANTGGQLGGRNGGLIGGRKNAESGHCQRISHLGASKGGLAGGPIVKARQVGIFNPNYENLGGVYERTEAHREASRNSRSPEERSETTRLLWQDPEYRKMMSGVGRENGRKSFEEKRGVFAPENLGKGAKSTNSQLWRDPDHPELGSHHFNTLKGLQKKNGYPCERGNRVKAVKQSMSNTEGGVHD
jgi:hypothetical protein